MKGQTNANAMSKEDAQLLELLVNQNKDCNNTNVDSDEDPQPNLKRPKISKTSERPLDKVNITDESDDSDDIKRQEQINDRIQKRKAEKVQTKPRYLLDKEERERSKLTPPESSDPPRRRERKEFTKHRDRDDSDHEASLPNLEDLGIKVEERNNQIMFDVSHKVPKLAFSSLPFRVSNLS